MTADEVLKQMQIVAASQADNPVCVIDPETRTITVPLEYQLLGVENDKRVERIPFRCPKIVGDNQDLSQDYILFVNYVNANGDPDAYKINDMQVDGDNITFSWLLEEKVTLYQGDIQISFCGIIPGDEQEDPDKNRWGTTINTDCTVLTGLKCTQQVAESNPDALAQIWAEIDELKAGGGGSSISVDSTLQVQGDAADAKVTGDAIRKERGRIDPIEELLESLQKTANSGKILIISASGDITVGDLPEGASAAEVAEVVMENYLEVIDSVNGEAVYTTEALEADLDTLNGEVI